MEGKHTRRSSARPLTRASQIMLIQLARIPGRIRLEA